MSSKAKNQNLADDVNKRFSVQSRHGRGCGRGGQSRYVPGSHQSHPYSSSGVGTGRGRGRGQSDIGSIHSSNSTYVQSPYGRQYIDDYHENYQTENPQQMTDLGWYQQHNWCQENSASGYHYTGYFPKGRVDSTGDAKDIDTYDDYRIVANGLFLEQHIPSIFNSHANQEFVEIKSNPTISFLSETSETAGLARGALPCELSWDQEVGQNHCEKISTSIVTPEQSTWKRNGRSESYADQLPADQVTQNQYRLQNYAFKSQSLSSPIGYTKQNSTINGRGNHYNVKQKQRRDCCDGEQQQQQKGNHYNGKKRQQIAKVDPLKRLSRNQLKFSTTPKSPQQDPVNKSRSSSNTDSSVLLSLADFPSLPHVDPSKALAATNCNTSMKKTVAPKVQIMKRPITETPAYEPSNAPTEISQAITKSLVTDLQQAHRSGNELLLKEEEHPVKSMAVSPSPVRDDTGNEHEFLRLVRCNKVLFPGSGGKLSIGNPLVIGGLQRLRPRRKNFSCLKKRILRERLERWKSSQQRKFGTEQKQMIDNDTVGIEMNHSVNISLQSCTVCLKGYTTFEEVSDDDEYEEIANNLIDLTKNVGPIRWVFIPRELTALPPISDDFGLEHVSFVEFVNSEDAAAAAACWDKLVLGGQLLKAVVRSNTLTRYTTEEEWRKSCLDFVITNELCQGLSHTQEAAEVLVENFITDDDLDDEDCLQECLNDLKALAQKFGPLDSVRLQNGPPPIVFIRYLGDKSTAKTAAGELGKAVIGGLKLSARLVQDFDQKIFASTNINHSTCVLLEDILTDDDINDEDCLEESLADISELAQQFGKVLKVDLDSGINERAVRIFFDAMSFEALKFALEGFNCMTIGGSTVRASLFDGQKTVAVSATMDSASELEVKNHTESKVMFTAGGKRIPAFFAECKKAPKDNNLGSPRPYATFSENEDIKRDLTEMLSELMRLQKRASNDKNAKARRRLVMGMREVARGLRAHKVNMVIIANNLDNYEALDVCLQEIIDLSSVNEVPIFYEFSKRSLGRAVGKSIKVAVVGVQSADGANQLFKKLKNLSTH